MKITLFIIPLLWAFLLTACTQATVPLASGVNPTLPTLPNTIATGTPLTAHNFNINGRILIYKSESLYVANADGTSPVLIHTIESPLSMVSLSPDGTKFAYFSGNSLYVKDITTGRVSMWNREMIGSIGGELRWSPDGKKIALACSTLEVTDSLCLIGESGHIEYLVREENIADGKRRHEYFIQLQDWSRDGTKLIFSYYSPSEKGQKQDFSIYSYDMTSRLTQRVLDGKAQSMIFQFRGASISPDNKNLLISGVGENSLFRVFVLSMETLRLAPLSLPQLPHTSYTNPVWSSDSCCYYVHAEQGDADEHTLMASLTGDIRVLDIQGVVLQWIK